MAPSFTCYVSMGRGWGGCRAVCLEARAEQPRHKLTAWASTRSRLDFCPGFHAGRQAGRPLKPQRQHRARTILGPPGCRGWPACLPPCLPTPCR